MPVLWIGLHLSRPLTESGTDLAFMLGRDLQPVGNSVIVQLLRYATHGGPEPLLLHPTAVAGWFGMFVTTLNLLPIAQLDGGHILFALAPRWHRRVGRVFWFLIMLLGYYSFTWLVWGLIILFLSRGQLAHPSVLDAYRPLPRSRHWLAWASLLLFLLTFVPAPFLRL
jgi:membrane-associated protease RseP (regulator of RpoE activity)